MIHTDFNWAQPVNLLLVIVALVLLAVQCGMLVARHRHSGRFGIRLVLNALLWISVWAWLLDPYFKSSTRSKVGLLIAENVPPEVAVHMRDSLRGADVIGADELRSRELDTLIIAGQQFDDAILAAIRQSGNPPEVRWLPYFATGEVRDLHWKGILRKGELQRIEGSIQTGERQMLQIRYGGQTLDSLQLNAGTNRLLLEFPAFTEGRTTTTLHLGGRTIDTLRFFAQPEEKLTVRFLLDNPDFETRNLATWLGKQGHAVIYEAALAKNIQNRLKINRPAEPDLIITTASNAADGAVRKVVNAGNSVLFLQLGEPLTELRAINAALGTGFQAVKVSNEESVPVADLLTAQPFRFETRGFQTKAPHYTVMTEKTTGKIAVSLLNETFAMQFSGDSAAYGKVWSEILAYVRPAKGAVIWCDAPVFKDVPAALQLNNYQPVPRFLTIGRDTVFTNISALNNLSATATYLPVQSGWLALNDPPGTEFYVQDYSPLRYASQMQHFIHSAQKLGMKNTAEDAQTSRKLPGWLWYAWLMVCLAVLWVEPKL